MCLVWGPHRFWSGRAFVAIVHPSLVRCLLMSAQSSINLMPASLQAAIPVIRPELQSSVEPTSHRQWRGVDGGYLGVSRRSCVVNFPVAELYPAGHAVRVDGDGKHSPSVVESAAHRLSRASIPPGGPCETLCVQPPQRRGTKRSEARSRTTNAALLCLNSACVTGRGFQPKC